MLFIREFDDYYYNVVWIILPLNLWSETFSRSVRTQTWCRKLKIPYCSCVSFEDFSRFMSVVKFNNSLCIFTMYPKNKLVFTVYFKKLFSKSDERFCEKNTNTDID